jgi:hypothetical protein
MINYFKFSGYAFVSGIRKAPQDLFRLIVLWPARLWNLLCELLDFIKNFRKRRRRTFRDSCCVDVPPDVLLRPDPLIYSQYYLLSQGLAVTWDNPDIELFDNGGNLVPSHKLVPNTEYEVRVRVWNGSFDAPAPGLPVYLSLLTFGINMVSTPIGKTSVNLSVRGAPGHPALATFKWKTPEVRGHYCLQARLDWSDDANPNNNLGQENVDVGVFQSPAVFQFPVRNEQRYPRQLHLTVDTYSIPELVPCDDVTPPRDERTPQTRLQESEAHWTIARKTHSREAFQVPLGWRVEILPTEIIDLGPLEERIVTVKISKPDGFNGRKAFNINAVEGNDLNGGVTLYVESKQG